MKKLLPLILLLVISIAVLVAGLEREEQVDDRPRSSTISTVHFNTFSAVYTYGDEDDTRIGKYRDIADEALGYYHKLFDIYYEYEGIDNIKTINKNAGKNPVKVDRELVDFLLYCKELYTKTNGKTNIMLGSVLKIWHDVREDALDDFGYLDPSRLPTDEKLAAAAEHTSIDLLVIEEEECTVYITDPKASIDVGAVAKGYAVDRIVEMLIDEGADSVVLNIGGNIRTIGFKPGENKWISGITNPDKESGETIKCRVEIGSESVVTSGDYERYFIAGDKKYHHIIDPDTLQPAEYFASVTIITGESALGDALSTALFCMPYDEGRALVDSLDGVEAIWIYRDGTVMESAGIKYSK